MKSFREYRAENDIWAQEGWSDGILDKTEQLRDFYHTPDIILVTKSSMLRLISIVCYIGMNGNV